MNQKQRINLSVEQKLEYAKLLVDEGYTNRRIREISGAGATTVSRWKRQYLAEINGQTPQGKKALTAEQQKFQELVKQLWRAKRDNEILPRCP